MSIDCRNFFNSFSMFRILSTIRVAKFLPAFNSALLLSKSKLSKTCKISIYSPLQNIWNRRRMEKKVGYGENLSGRVYAPPNRVINSIQRFKPLCFLCPPKYSIPFDSFTFRKIAICRGIKIVFLNTIMKHMKYLYV